MINLNVCIHFVVENKNIFSVGKQEKDNSWKYRSFEGGDVITLVGRVQVMTILLQYINSVISHQLLGRVTTKLNTKASDAQKVHPLSLST